MNAHGEIDALGIDHRHSLALSLAAQYAPDAAIAIAAQMRNGAPNLFDPARIIGLPGTATIPPIYRPSQLFRHVGARYTEDVAYPLHWATLGKEGKRAIHFRDFITSTGSRRISFSMVFFPSSRCNSRTCLRASLSSEAGTTSSPALTADRLPSWYSLRHWKELVRIPSR